MKLTVLIFDSQDSLLSSKHEQNPTEDLPSDSGSGESHDGLDSSEFTEDFCHHG